ncbi:MAG: DEAD/DEAH box helicase, partial [Desulfohalobiaceae bacterium]
MPPRGDIASFVKALKASALLGHQVVHHQVLPARKGGWKEPGVPFHPTVQALLDESGIQSLYTHQARAVDLARSGRDTVVATPTASGKTLCYTLPVLDAVARDPKARALYLFPLKALAQDQLRTFEDLTARWQGPDRPTTAIYDGDTTSYKRGRIRQSPPNVLLSNPEMLHLSILPFHEQWAGFLKDLRFVVVDEAHTYRGVMGSNMAWVFRRFERVCSHYGAKPTFIFSTATVGNPKELAQQLTGRAAEVVTESTAPVGHRHFLFINPFDGAARGAIQLLQAALPRGLRTIVYTQSRKMTELIAVWAAESCPDFAGRISAYRAGFLPEERREIEARLAGGELLAVVSTSALELGIDIGNLDLCLLVGYPGSIMATWQRSGRVGRSSQESAVVLLGHEDALDQYFMANPGRFFDLAPESAVLNPSNPVVMDRHLACAAADLPVDGNEPWLQQPGVMASVKRLEARGELLVSADGSRIFSSRKAPQRRVNLRGAGSPLRILDGESE